MIFPEVKLRCGDCNVCCQQGCLVVPLEKEEEKDLELYKAVEYKGYLSRGRKYEIPKKGNGHCIHLENGRCAIYEKRPTNCAGFDCRMEYFGNDGSGYGSDRARKAVKLLAAAAAKLNTRTKQSVARRFNDALRI